MSMFVSRLKLCVIFRVIDEATKWTGVTIMIHVTVLSKLYTGRELVNKLQLYRSRTTRQSKLKLVSISEVKMRCVVCVSGL